MKYLTLILVGLFIAGCVEADTPGKFKTEDIGYAYWNIRRTVDTDYNVACYTHREMISCVKL